MSKQISFSIYKLIVTIFFFITTWLFLWLFYGDVLYQLQERSFWFFAPIFDFQTLKIQVDYFTYISRFCITIFAVPVLGALLLSLILTFIEFLTQKIFVFRKSLYLLSYLPSLILLILICSHDKSIYYDRENSEIFKILLITLFGFLLLWPISNFFKKNNNKQYVDNIQLKAFLLPFVCILLSFFFLNLYANRDKEFRTITALKYYVDQKKWGKVASIAEHSNISSRIIAGYHAVALSQIGQIGDRLFKVDYDFDPLKSYSMKDDVFFGTVLSTPHLLFYGGLSQPAYHYAFEYFIIYGNYKAYLKMMARSLVVNKDRVLADRMLDIIERMPFEGDFVKKYRKYNHFPELMSNDLELAPILDLKLPQDDFEQGFGIPLATNYYLRTSPRGRTQRFQDLSLAACLYYKNLQLFAYKCSVLLKRNSIPKHFQEAVAMIAATNHNTELLKTYKISQQINASVMNFLTEQSMHKNDPDKGKRALSHYKGTLMYYIAFENEQLEKYK